MHTPAITVPASPHPRRPRDVDADDLSGLPRQGDLLDGRYEVEGMLGMGGMAVVLAATHLDLQESVAIKMLLPEWADDPEIVERFMREGRASTKIRSEHVVRVLDVGRVFRRPFLVMELLVGRDLEQLVRDLGGLPTATAVDYLLQVIEAVAEAHALGIIHRDLKPANLFLTHRADGSPCVKVLDFGLSKHLASADGACGATKPNVMMGSPRYMSPEQMQSARDADARSDIWSLGAILHELIAGTAPWHADSTTALCAAILKDPAPPLTQFRADVPPPLASAVLRCLEKDRTRRFQTVAELARALAPFGSEEARVSEGRIRRVLEATRDERLAMAQAAHRPRGRRTPLAAFAGTLRGPVRLPLAGLVAGGLLLFALAGGSTAIALGRLDVRRVADATAAVVERWVAAAERASNAATVVAPAQPSAGVTRAASGEPDGGAHGS